MVCVRYTSVKSLASVGRSKVKESSTKYECSTNNYALYFMQSPHMHPVKMLLTNLYYEISGSNQYWKVV